MRAVLLLYNTDYDEELIAASPTDVSAVREAAMAVHRALLEYGLQAEIVGVHGDDLAEVLPTLRNDSFDLVFNLVESLRGDTRNEQVIPSLLELYQRPFTGPNALTLNLCLHKDKCKLILLGEGVATPDYLLLAPDMDLDEPALQQRLQGLPYPYFVKLAREDASIGIEARNRVTNPRDLVARARELLQQYRQPVLAERYIDGREVNVTVLGNGDELVLLPLHEIDFAKMPPGRPHIVSYAAKWDEKHVDYDGTKPVLMKDLTAEHERAIADTARAAFKALGLRDFGRVDLRIDGDGKPWVIDVNPNCDLSPDAGVARAALAGGMAYAELIGRICEIAWRRHERANS